MILMITDFGYNNYYFYINRQEIWIVDEKMFRLTGAHTPPPPASDSIRPTARPVAPPAPHIFSILCEAPENLSGNL
jgi:hypothetical protein